MTLIVALKTDKAVYLASDSCSTTEMANGYNQFKSVKKYVKVNNHVEILFAGYLELALASLEKVKRNLWEKGLDEESYDAYEIADEIEEVVYPAYRDITHMLLVKAALMNDKEILKKSALPELIIGGMDKDKKGDFVSPVIYVLEPACFYRKRKITINGAICGAQEVTEKAEDSFGNLLFADTSDSSIDYEERIYSCFREVIQKLKQECDEGEDVAVKEPIHIARITKEGYELLREE
ncbi:MAG: hypothetical protein WBC40_10950 [Halobacteriota archaeon]